MQFWKKKIPYLPRYTFTATGRIIYFAALAIVLGLMLTRGNHAFWNHVPIIGTFELYRYMSNFCISFLIIVAAGMSNPFSQHANRTVFVWAGALAAANLIIEFGITILNIRDWHDAIAGFIGIALGLVLVLAMKHYSLLLPPEQK